MGTIREVRIGHGLQGRGDATIDCTLGHGARDESVGSPRHSRVDRLAGENGALRDAHPAGGIPHQAFVEHIHGTVLSDKRLRKVRAGIDVRAHGREGGVDIDRWVKRDAPVNGACDIEMGAVRRTGSRLHPRDVNIPVIWAACPVACHKRLIIQTQQNGRVDGVRRAPCQTLVG